MKGRNKELNKHLKIISIFVLLCLSLLILIGCKNSDDNKSTDGTTVNDETTVKEPEPQEKYDNLLWSTDEVELYTNDSDVKGKGTDVALKLVADGESLFFKGSFDFGFGEDPRYYRNNLDSDRYREYIIILPLAEGSVLNNEEIHIFDGETLKEQNLENPEDLFSDFTLSSDETSYVIKYEDPTYAGVIREVTRNKSLFVSWGTDALLETPEIDKRYAEYSVHEDTYAIHGYVTVKYPVYVAKDHGEYYGNISVSYSFEDEKSVRNSVYVGTCGYSDYKNDESGINWEMRAYDGKIIVLNGDKRYVYGDYSSDPSMKDFHIPDVATEPEGMNTSIKYFPLSGHVLISYTKERQSVKDPLCDKVVMLGASSGVVIFNIELSVEEILSATGLSADILKPYTYEESETGEAAYSVRVGNGIELDYNHWYNYTITFILESEDSRVRLYRDLQHGTYSDNKKISYTNDYINPVKVITSVEDIDVFMADDDIKSMVRAFLTNDTETMEKCMNYPSGVLAPYKDLRFGDYKISDDPYGDALIVEVEITESSLDTILPDKYKLTFAYVFGNGGRVGINGLKNSEISGNKKTSKATTFIAMWQNSACEFSFDRVNATENLAENHSEIVYFLAWYRDLGTNTPERYKEEAKKVFNMDNLDVSVYLHEDGTVQAGGRGGPSFYYTVESETVEDGIITVRIQTYVDYMYTIKSDVYEYKFEDMGDYLRAISCELVEKGEYRYGGVSV